MALALCGSTGRADAELTTALEVRSLGLAQAEEEPPVRLTGVVTFSDPPSTVFIQDETAGTFFRLQGRTPPLPGDEVEVRGQAFPGLYLSGIQEADFEVLSRPGIPEAIPATYDDLMSGRLHYQRVAIEGIVRTVTPKEEAGSIVRLAVGSRVIEIHVEKPPPTNRDFVDCRVSVSGLAAGHINARRQLVEPYLRCADWAEFSVLEPAVPTERVPGVSSSELLNFDVEGHGGHRVKIGGTVLAAFPGGEVFLRDGESAIGVTLLVPDPAIRPGDYLAVVGFPEMSRFSAALADASSIGHEAREHVPDPRNLSPRELMDGEADEDLVAVEADLVDFYRTDSGGVLVLQRDGLTIQARTPGFPEDLTAGSRVRATGICQVETTRSSSYRSEPESVSLRLRSPSDIEVLAQPGWWTPQRLVHATIALLVAVALAGLWIGLLRRQVSRQTVALRHRIEHEAALEERQRIAREFHDTLEQELAGLSLRLDAAVAHGPRDKLKGLLEGSRSLVSRIQLETRNLVSDLRDTQAGSADLEAPLRELVARQPAGVGPEVVLHIEPDTAIPALPSRTVHHLKMIAQEAITNALKHSGAEQIHLTMEIVDDALLMEIVDDGRGFDFETETQGGSGHFGCMGIRERCSRIGAEVKWSGGEGEGTRLTVRMPLSFPEKNRL